MTNYQRWLFLKIIPYTVIAVISAIAYWVLEVSFLGDHATYPFTGNIYKPGNSLIAITTMSIIFGTGIGFIEETIFKKKFRSQSFLLIMVQKTMIYLSLLLTLLFFQSLVLTAINLGKPIFDERVIGGVFTFFSSPILLSTVVYIGLVIGAGLLFSEIIDYLGMDVVGSFITGKYNKSVNEERIFMFLDMKDSTTIAEKLGHKLHYKFINEYYGDMTNPIIETKGRIYQYVGDEIVLSWGLVEGLTKSNCLNCFFLIKEKIESKKEIYLKKYGFSPEFKAALHHGQVTRGRVGFIKKELLFTGDVLNTAARIQSMCKELDADLLISNELRDQLLDVDFDFLDRGVFSLRGRKREVKLVEVLAKK
ncbi:MAG: adenylate/guanylate cyclase domain-containing protein [Flavobacteriaceae bacterium]